MRKAVAPHVMYILIVIVLSILAVIVVFKKWLGPFQTEMIRSACIGKHNRYCSDWKKSDYGPEPWGWNDKLQVPSPDLCEGPDMSPKIPKPTSPSDCE